MQVCGGICFVAGALLQALGQDIAMLYIGRLILGGGIGFANQVLLPIAYKYGQSH